MHTTFNRSSLVNALSKINKVIKGNEINPMFNGVLVETLEDGNAQLSMSDGDNFCRATISCMTKTQGSVVVNSKLFFNLCKAIESDDIIFEISEKTNSVSVKGGKGKYKLSIIGSKDAFIGEPKFDGNKTINILPKEFSESISKVIFAVSNQAHQYSITGVLFDFDDDKLHLVGTDSHRMGITTIKLNDNLGKYSMVVPSKLLSNIPTLLEDTEVSTIITSDSFVKFVLGNIEIYAKLFENKFPEYKRVIPHTSHSFQVPKIEFIKSIERAMLFLSQVVRSIHIVGNKNTFEVSCSNGQTGESNDSISIKDGIEIPIDAHITSDLLVEILKHIDGDSVTIKYNENEAKSIIIEDPKNASYMYLMTLILRR